MLSNKKLVIILLLLCVGLQAPSTTSAQSAPADTNEKALTLKWLGNAGWEIQFGQTVILIDPFLTRGEASPSAEWKTDEEAVLRVIKRADYIFAGHSHADHIADVPFIAKKFGSKVIGSRTTTNIALTGGIDKSQLVTISGVETLNEQPALMSLYDFGTAERLMVGINDNLIRYSVGIEDTADLIADLAAALDCI